MTFGDLTEQLRAEPYAGYTYGYPHKTAYGPLRPATNLAEAWADESLAAVFGYLHLPFCEMRCGFCNLFTTANPADDLVDAYLRALRREVQTIRCELPPIRAARLALGGGTPTYLEPRQLDEVFALMADAFGVTPAAVPTSVETSPATASADRLAALAQAGVSRISIGVQSFDLAEVHSAGRPAKSGQVTAALDAIRAHAPDSALNIDLMYGLEGQSVQTWLSSLHQAMHWAPDEVFCYPLYVRHLTGLGRHPRQWSDQRLELYRQGRDFLLANGYQQTSMRRFVRTATQSWSEPEYYCQSDAMVGLGCGARSYTRELHYSREYAVGRSGVRNLIESYATTTDFTLVEHGIRLSLQEQQRRYVLQSVLHADGLDETAFHERFQVAPQVALPQLADLVESGLAYRHDATVQLTPDGLELSDAIGPWLYSDDIRRASEAFAWR